MSTTTSAPATTSTIGHELVDLCRAGKNGDAVERFYSPNIVSIESMGSEEMPAEVKGIDAVHKKHQTRGREERGHEQAAGSGDHGVASAGAGGI